MPQAPLSVVFLDHDTIAPQTTLPPFAFAHQLQVYGRTAPEQVADRIAQADIVLTNKVAIRHDDLRQAGRLGLIAVAATGVDNIDLAACEKRGIVVSNIQDYASTTVPEHTIALMFALRRSILPYHESVRQGRWQRAQQFSYFDFPIRDLAGSTLGIVGRGTLGRATGELARSLGMKVVYAARKGAQSARAPYERFDDVLATSDVISLHCPLTDDTHHLLSTDEFAAMARNPLIINTARGGLIDEAALAHALHSGQISGAAVDVASAEPPPADHVFMSLLDLPNFIMTPHVGWASNEAMQGLANQLVENVNAFVRGQPRNVVTAHA